MKHLVLTLLGLLSFCLAIRAEVYSGECGDNGNNLTWTLDTETGKLVISGNGAMTQNPWRDYRNYIRTVDIQEGVKSIVSNAFHSCYLITNARIPDSVIDIGDNAFYDCLGLKSIVIGRSVTSIGIQAFTSCSNLRTIINFSSLAITKGSTSNGSVAFNACQVVSNPNSIEENFVFSIIDGVNTLMAYIGDNTEIVLPDNYRGEGYVIGENAFYSNLTVTSIVIPDNVTSIGDWAFYNCRLLESINIPNSITDIGDMAFRQCSKLKNIILSNTLRSVGYRIFCDCIELESMEIPNSVTSIGKEAFYNCASLKDVTIGSNVMSIGEYAFASCETLANVKMPCSITKIEEYAFNGCEALTFIIIPPSVTSLGRRIFEGCRNLKTIINLSSIQFIISSNDNYSHMPSYSDIIKIDAPNGSIEGDYVFGIIEGTNTLCKYLGNDSDIILPYNYKGGKYRIGAEAFSNNETISNVMIPDGIINIGNDAFEYCTSLTGIAIPNSVTSIGTDAFFGCSSLTSVIIPNSVTSIGNRAFYGCSGLTSVTIGSGVKNIYSIAFANCPELLDVYCLAEKVPSTDSYAFSSSIYSNATLHVPAGSVATYKTTEPWSGFENIVAFSPFSGEVEIDGINYELNGETKQATVIAKSSGYYSGEIVIPESVEYGGNTYSVKSIGNEAFYGSPLKSVKIPESVTHIGFFAFVGTQLQSIEIPGSVTDLSIGAFSNCESLQNVILNEGLKTISWLPSSERYNNGTFEGCENLVNINIPNTVTTIGVCAFSGCRSLQQINIPNSVTELGSVAFQNCSSLESVTIPNSVKSIGDWAFCGCSGLTSVTIPNSVKSIGDWAFADCSGLTSVTIGSGVETIGSYSFANCPELLDVYCYAENVPSTGSDAFDGSYIEYVNLHVPAASLANYKTTAPWSSFGAIKALPQAMTIVDGELFENDEEQTLSTLTYTRTLHNLYWNALYVPFEIPVSEIIDKYEVAYVNNVNSYDHNDDGTIDDMRMEVIKIKSGTLNANYPYLIKARNEEAKNMTITMENTTLFQSVETTIDCSSVFAKHEITGIYNKRYKNELPEGAMAISMAGAWQPIASGSYLNPFRLYMTITARDGSPVKVEPAAMSRIRISVLGEDVETDIEETRSETKNIILDLSGRSVQNPAKGRVYIVNGKKVIF